MLRRPAPARQARLPPARSPRCPQLYLPDPPSSPRATNPPCNGNYRANWDAGPTHYSHYSTTGCLCDVLLLWLVVVVVVVSIVREWSGETISADRPRRPPSPAQQMSAMRLAGCLWCVSSPSCHLARDATWIRARLTAEGIVCVRVCMLGFGVCVKGGGGVF